MARISTENAQKTLSDVPRENNFYSNDGRVLKSLSDFASYLQVVDTSTFKYHVNQERNDFSKWILEVIGDTKLSRELMRVRSKETCFRKVNNRIEELKLLIEKK